MEKGIKSGLSIDEIKIINEIICGLIVENMKAGSSYKKAVDQAYNRMEKDHPEVLVAWLNHTR